MINMKNLTDMFTKQLTEMATAFAKVVYNDAQEKAMAAIDEAFGRSQAKPVTNKPLKAKAGPVADAPRPISLSHKRKLIKSLALARLALAKKRAMAKKAAASSARLDELVKSNKKASKQVGLNHKALSAKLDHWNAKRPHAHN